MSTGGVLIVVALAIWATTELIELLLRRRARTTVFTHDRPPPWWLGALNILALGLGCVGFVIWLTQDPRNFGIGL